MRLLAALALVVLGGCAPRPASPLAGGLGVPVTVYAESGRPLAVLTLAVASPPLSMSEACGVWSAQVMGDDPDPAMLTAWNHFARAATPRYLSVAYEADGAARVWLTAWEGPVGSDEVFLEVRGGERSGTWTHWTDGGVVEEGRWESSSPMLAR